MNEYPYICMCARAFACTARTKLTHFLVLYNYLILPFQHKITKLWRLLHHFELVDKNFRDILMDI